MGLLSLHYDIFSTISCMLDQRSRLHLALTCRFAKGVIIPNILFRDVELARDFDRIFLFYRAIMNPSSNAAAAIRSFTCRGKADERSCTVRDMPSLLGHIMEKTVNLHTVDIVLEFHSAGPQLFKKISALPKLRSVTLRELYEGQAEYISSLAQLRTLRISFRSGGRSTDTSALFLMAIMLNSQQTLQTLELPPTMPLQLEHLSEASPSKDRPPMWPSLRILDAHLSTPRAGSPSPSFDLSTAFPSVHHFVSPPRINYWLTSPLNRTFLSRLTSVEGGWESVRIVVKAGAPLQRIAVTGSGWTPDTDLRFLPPDLGCFSMALKEEDVSAFVCCLSEITLLKMKVFHLQIESTPHDPDQYQSSMSSLMVALAGIDWIMDLDYLSVEWVSDWDYVPYRKVDTGSGFLIDFVRAAPSVRQVRVCVRERVTHWRRLVPSDDTSEGKKGASYINLSVMQSGEEDNYQRVGRWMM